MDFTPVHFLDSPPYKPADEESSFFTVTDTDLAVWNSFSLITPPLTPVDISTHDKEVITHLSNNETRNLSDERESSPAILNDIMWNSGQKHKRPDSAMDIDVRFNLNGTPLSFDQPIANTYVDATELFSFAPLLENCCDSHDAENRHSGAAQDSDSEEEIDVVSVQVEPKAKPTLASKEITASNTIKPRITLQKAYNDTRGKDYTSGTSDSEGEVTRISHNDLERKRRNELRSRFNNLRESIPSLSTNDKAAKITILRKAYELMPVLQREEKKLLAEKEQEKRKHTELLRKLTKLNARLKLR